MQVKNRLAKIREEIEQVARQANRDPEEIKLVAVSKTHSLDQVRKLAAEGINDFGESRVQELREKYNDKPDLNWHMIGHLQRNKVKYLARMDNCQLIHSLDSLRLAKKIEDRAGKEDRQMKALVQVNVARDENKYGFAPEEVREFLEQVASFSHLQIKGLMTLVPHVEDPETVRPYFSQLRELATELQEAKIPGIKIEELSMGMTNDFKVAIEEGATIVRIGRGIFGAREYE